VFGVNTRKNSPGGRIKGKRCQRVEKRIVEQDQRVEKTSEGKRLVQDRISGIEASPGFGRNQGEEETGIDNPGTNLDLQPGTSPPAEIRACPYGEGRVVGRRSKKEEWSTGLRLVRPGEVGKGPVGRGATKRREVHR